MAGFLVNTMTYISWKVKEETSHINRLKTEIKLNFLKVQSLPRSKHMQSRLWKRIR
jgi:hypothetical protein